MNSLVFMSPRVKHSICRGWQVLVQLQNDELRHRFQTYGSKRVQCEGAFVWFILVYCCLQSRNRMAGIMVGYIKGNVDFTETYLKEHIPPLK